MRLVWTPDAADDLEALIEYIRADKEGLAVRAAQRVIDRLTALSPCP